MKHKGHAEDGLTYSYHQSIAEKIPTMSDRLLKHKLCDMAPALCLKKTMRCEKSCRFGEEAQRRVAAGVWAPEPYSRRPRERRKEKACSG